MSEVLGGLEIPADEPDNSSSEPSPSRTSPTGDATEPLLFASSDATSQASEAELVRLGSQEGTSDPQQQLQQAQAKPTWRAHEALKQAVTDWNDNIKQHAKGVMEKLSGTSSAGSFKMLSNTDVASGKWIKELSSMANVVVGRCARVLLLKPEELKENFEEEAPAQAKEPARFPRNFLEYCCFRALAVATQVSDHLRDKDFRRWTFDMMLAWEAPGTINQLAGHVEAESSASLDAFARLAPAIPLVADSVTVHALFELLTEETHGRMPFFTYNKYLTELDKTVKTIKGLTTNAVTAALGIIRGEEAVVETDGGTPTQPVLQHIGVTAWPGRVTLTDQAFYFEPSGVVSYDAAKKYDLTADLKHVVKSELTGPWGAKIFDKAIMYKSTAIQEPVVLEFAELTGHMRRDYWLAILKEIVAVHAFVRQHRLDGVPRRQSIAKAVRGIARLKTLWALSKSLPSNPEMHLTYLCADELPGGDAILRAMANALRQGDVISPQKERQHLEAIGELVGAAAAAAVGGVRAGGDGGKGKGVLENGAAGRGSPVVTSQSGAPGKWGTGGSAAAAAVAALLPSSGLMPPSTPQDASMPVGDVLVGELTALERAVMSSRENSKKVAKAKRTVDDVKVEGMGPNVALLQELLLPLMIMGEWVHSLAAWEEPVKTAAFLIFALYIIYRDWLCFLVPFLLVCNAAITIWLRFAQASFIRSRHPSRRRRNEVVVVTPPNKSAVEQLLVIQAAIAQVESAIQSLNIVMLKLRALALSELPQATDELIALQLVLAVALAILPIRFVALALLLEVFTRDLEFRREQTERIMRRIKEWWHRIPVVPVRFIEQDHDPRDDLF